MQPILETKQLCHVYSEGTPFQQTALHDVDFTAYAGEYLGIIGHTGSGKSTLIQHLNGLLKPTSGRVLLDGRDIWGEGSDIRQVRFHVGLVFQFPEYQLFEESVEKDIAFGPKNFGASSEEASAIAKRILPYVGLGEEYLQRSPFELSGGQKRRVAIAGILAMDPNVLVLDEPTAGLDPQGAREMMELFVRMNREFHKTVLLVTHDMEHVLRYCDDVVVVKDGSICTHQSVTDFFRDPSILKELRITPPAVIRLREALNARGFSLADDLLSIEALAAAVASEVKGHE